MKISNTDNYNNSNVVAIIATGESLSNKEIEILRKNNIPLIAVSDAYTLAPDAISLVSSDVKWWNVKKPKFNGKKFSSDYTNLSESITSFNKPASTNSTALACYVAIEEYGFNNILLFGVDFSGSHFFGQHKPPLKNTNPKRWPIFKKQFEDLQDTYEDVDIINCNLFSSLSVFKKLDIITAIQKFKNKVIL